MGDIDWFPPLPELHRVVMVSDRGRWRPAIRREAKGNGTYIVTYWEFVDAGWDRSTCRTLPHWRECDAMKTDLR